MIYGPLSELRKERQCRKAGGESRRGSLENSLLISHGRFQSGSVTSHCVALGSTCVPPSPHLLGIRAPTL